MYGWIFTLNKDMEKIKLVKQETLWSINADTYSCFYNPLRKFEKDKIFYHSEDYFILVDGVIFNKQKLIQEAGGMDWLSTIINMYEEEGETFYDAFRGTFNGIVYDKKKEQIIAFTNHIGERTVFYYKEEDTIIIASNFNYIYNFLLENKFTYSLCTNAFESMLTFGYMLDESTYIAEIKRLFPGHFIKIKENALQVKQYFEFDSSKEIEIDENGAIELIDEYFRNAVKLEFDKDQEYGYQSLVDLSGGMDSRMVAFVSKEMGYDNVLNISYSQIGSYEKKITEQVELLLNHDYIHKALDSASFLYEVDEIVKQNYGLGYFAGITGGKQLLETLNMNAIGIEHTGLLGDVYYGSFSSKVYHEKAYFDKEFRVSQLLEINLSKTVLDRYKNHEMFCFYTRGLLGGLGTHLIRQNYTETFSPFEDVDFLTLSHKLPLALRVDGHIFRKWAIKKYPITGEILYASTMCRIDESDLKIKLKSKLRSFITIHIRKFLYSMGLVDKKNSKKSMNPFEYWYETNPDLRKFIFNYYRENIHLINKYPNIGDRLKTIQEKGNTIDKMIMMTVISVLKQYFNAGTSVPIKE
jgi:asparagine synthase (glutamine-hydrolysing)